MIIIEREREISKQEKKESFCKQSRWAIKGEENE
jgi:hypothetical protein